MHLLHALNGKERFPNYRICNKCTDIDCNLNKNPLQKMLVVPAVFQQLHYAVAQSQDKGKAHIGLINCHGQAKATPTEDKGQGLLPIQIYKPGQIYAQCCQSHGQHVSVCGKFIAHGGGNRRKRHQQTAAQANHKGTAHLKNFRNNRRRHAHIHKAHQTNDPGKVKVGTQPAGNPQKPPAGFEHILAAIKIPDCIVIGQKVGKTIKMHQKANYHRR